VKIEEEGGRRKEERGTMRNYLVCYFLLVFDREADKVKDEGNAAFKAGNFHEAIMKYTDAIALCPLSARKKQAIYYR
jgi:hypothetical protein